MKKLIQLFFIVPTLCIFAISYVWGGELTVTYDSSNGLANNQIADANHINTNFDDVEQEVNDNDSRIVSIQAALPLMWASTDNSIGGIGVTNSGPVQTNAVDVDAPYDGFIVISGGVFINNDTASPINYALKPYIDGSDVSQSSVVAAYFAANTEGNPGESGSVSYTLTVPITAGTYTVTQEVGPFDSGTTADFFYNAYNLTVIYYPTSQGGFTAASFSFNSVLSNKSVITEDGN